MKNKSAMRSVPDPSSLVKGLVSRLRSASVWEKVACRLHFAGSRIRAIGRSAHFRVEEACRAVFDVWLEGEEDLLTPRTWEMVVAVLKEADLCTLSDELNSILSD